MNTLSRAGIGFAVIALSLLLPSLSFSFIDFSQIDNMVLLVMQIGLMLFGLGFAVGGGK